MSFVLGTIRAGSTIVRQATAADHLENMNRVVMIEEKDGIRFWLCLDGTRERVCGETADAKR